MKHIDRRDLLQTLHGKVAQGKPLILAGAGCGLAARAEEEAGADLIMAYNTGIYRMDGHVSLVGYRYYSDGNEDSTRLARELNGAVRRTPVVAGICADDPFQDMDAFLDRLLELGYSGVTNVPSIAGPGQKPGTVFGSSIRHYALGAQAEIALVRRCAQRGIFTAMYAYNEADIRALTGAGVDLISVHVGGTAGGSTGALGENLLSLQAAAEMTERCFALARQENPSVLVVTHGGPFEDPASMAYCFAHAHCHGYIGASGVERIPVEKELRQVYASYRKLRLADAEG